MTGLDLEAGNDFSNAGTGGGSTWRPAATRGRHEGSEPAVGVVAAAAPRRAGRGRSGRAARARRRTPRGRSPRDAALFSFLLEPAPRAVAFPAGSSSSPPYLSRGRRLPHRAAPLLPAQAAVVAFPPGRASPPCWSRQAADAFPVEPRLSSLLGLAVELGGGGGARSRRRGGRAGRRRSRRAGGPSC